MLDVLAQHCREVAGPGDQEMVEALAAQGADEAFGDRVGSRRSDRCPEHLGVDGGEDGVERGGELWNVPDFIDTGLGCQVGEFPES